MGTIDWARELVTSAAILLMGAAAYFVVTRTRIIPKVKVRKRYWSEKRKAQWAFFRGHPLFAAVLVSLGILSGLMMFQDALRLCGFDDDNWILIKYPFAMFLGLSYYLSFKHIWVDEENGTPLSDSSEKA